MLEQEKTAFKIKINDFSFNVEATRYREEVADLIKDTYLVTCSSEYNVDVGDSAKTFSFSLSSKGRLSPLLLGNLITAHVLMDIYTVRVPYSTEGKLLREKLMEASQVTLVTELIAEYEAPQ
jgi:hypothetical protein